MHVSNKRVSGKNVILHKALRRLTSIPEKMQLQSKIYEWYQCVSVAATDPKYAESQKGALFGKCSYVKVTYVCIYDND